MKVMFICTGNICRSAMAHKMFEKKVKEANQKIEIHSSGIFAESRMRITMGCTSGNGRIAE